MINNIFNKDMKIENEYLQNKIKLLEEDNEYWKKRIKSLPNLSEIPEKYSEKLLEAYIEIRIAFKYELIRLALFNVVCIIEYILKDNFEEKVKSELQKKGKEPKYVYLHDLILAAFKSDFISEKDFNFLLAIKLTRNESIHDLSKVTEAEFRIAYQILDSILTKIK